MNAFNKNCKQETKEGFKMVIWRISIYNQNGFQTVSTISWEKIARKDLREQFEINVKYNFIKSFAVTRAWVFLFHKFFFLKIFSNFHSHRVVKTNVI